MINRLNPFSTPPPTPGVSGDYKAAVSNASKVRPPPAANSTQVNSVATQAGALLLNDTSVKNLLDEACEDISGQKNEIKSFEQKKESSLSKNVPSTTRRNEIANILVNLNQSAETIADLKAYAQNRSFGFKLTVRKLELENEGLRAKCLRLLKEEYALQGPDAIKALNAEIIEANANTAKAVDPSDIDHLLGTPAATTPAEAYFSHVKVRDALMSVKTAAAKETSTANKTKLENAEAALIFIESQNQELFEKLLQEASPEARAALNDFQKLMGRGYPIPLDFKIALLLTAAKPKNQSAITNYLKVLNEIKEIKVANPLAPIDKELRQKETDCRRALVSLAFENVEIMRCFSTDLPMFAIAKIAFFYNTQVFTDVNAGVAESGRWEEGIEAQRLRNQSALPEEKKLAEEGLLTFDIYNFKIKNKYTQGTDDKTTWESTQAFKGSDGLYRFCTYQDIIDFSYLGNLNTAKHDTALTFLSVYCNSQHPETFKKFDLKLAKISNERKAVISKDPNFWEWMQDPDYAQRLEKYEKIAKELETSPDAKLIDVPKNKRDDIVLDYKFWNWVEKGKQPTSQEVKDANYSQVRVDLEARHELFKIPKDTRSILSDNADFWAWVDAGSDPAQKAQFQQTIDAVNGKYEKLLAAADQFSVTIIRSISTSFLNTPGPAKVEERTTLATRWPRVNLAHSFRTSMKNVRDGLSGIKGRLMKTFAKASSAASVTSDVAATVLSSGDTRFKSQLKKASPDVKARFERALSQCKGVPTPQEKTQFLDWLNASEEITNEMLIADKIPKENILQREVTLRDLSGRCKAMQSGGRALPIAKNTSSPFKEIYSKQATELDAMVTKSTNRIEKEKADLANFMKKEVKLLGTKLSDDQLDRLVTRLLVSPKILAEFMPVFNLFNQQDIANLPEVVVGANLLVIDRLAADGQGGPLMPLLEIVYNNEDLKPLVLAFLSKPEFQDLQDLSKLSKEQLTEVSTFVSKCKEKLTKEDYPNATDNGARAKIQKDIAVIDKIFEQVNTAEAALLAKELAKAGKNVNAAFTEMQQITGVSYKLSAGNKLALLTHFTPGGKVDEARVAEFRAIMKESQKTQAANLEKCNKNELVEMADSTKIRKRLDTALKKCEPPPSDAMMPNITDFIEVFTTKIGSHPNVQPYTDCMALASGGGTLDKAATTDTSPFGRFARNSAASQREINGRKFMPYPNGLLAENKWEGEKGSPDRTLTLTLAAINNDGTAQMREIKGTIHLGFLCKDVENHEPALFALIKELCEGGNEYREFAFDFKTINDPTLQDLLFPNKEFWNWKKTGTIPANETKDSMKQMESIPRAKLEAIISIADDFKNEIQPQYVRACIELGGPAGNAVSEAVQKPPTKQLSPLTPLADIVVKHPNLLVPLKNLLIEPELRNLTDISKLPTQKLLTLDNAINRSINTLNEKLLAAKGEPAKEAIREDLRILAKLLVEIRETETAVFKQGCEDAGLTAMFEDIQRIAGSNFKMPIQAKLALLEILSFNPALKEKFGAILRQAEDLKRQVYTSENPQDIKTEVPLEKSIEKIFENMNDPFLRQFMAIFPSRIGNQMALQVLTDQQSSRHIMNPEKAKSSFYEHLPPKEQKLLAEGFVLEADDIFCLDRTKIEGNEISYNLTLAVPEETTDGENTRKEVPAKLDISSLSDMDYTDTDKFELFQMARDMVDKSSYQEVLKNKNLTSFVGKTRRHLLWKDDKFWKWIEASKQPENPAMSALETKALANLQKIANISSSYREQVVPKYLKRCVELGSTKLELEALKTKTEKSPPGFDKLVDAMASFYANKEPPLETVPKSASVSEKLLRKEGFKPILDNAFVKFESGDIEVKMTIAKVAGSKTSPTASQITTTFPTFRFEGLKVDYIEAFFLFVKGEPIPSETLRKYPEATLEKCKNDAINFRNTLLDVYTKALPDIFVA